MRTTGIVMVIGVACFLSGCGVYRVSSDPPGATVYVGIRKGNKVRSVRPKGETPTWQWDVYDAVKVRWPDGTESCWKKLFILRIPLVPLPSIPCDVGFSKNDPADLQSDYQPTVVVQSNRAQLTVNSEPQGAKLYAGGRYLGTTPWQGYYTIENHHYQAGSLRTTGFTVVYPGYRPGGASLSSKSNATGKPIRTTPILKTETSISTSSLSYSRIRTLRDLSKSMSLRDRKIRTLIL